MEQKFGWEWIKLRLTWWWEFNERGYRTMKIMAEGSHFYQTPAKQRLAVRWVAWREDRWKIAAIVISSLGLLFVILSFFAKQTVQ